MTQMSLMNVTLREISQTNKTKTNIALHHLFKKSSKSLMETEQWFSRVSEREGKKQKVSVHEVVHMVSPHTHEEALGIFYTQHWSCC